jgi:hypothetical protein
MNDNYEELANAIILAAVSDYCEIVKDIYALIAKTRSKSLQKRVRGIVTRSISEKDALRIREHDADALEQWFRSDEFRLLTKVDGDQIINICNAKAIRWYMEENK